MITFADKHETENVNIPFTIADKENLNHCVRLIKEMTENVKGLQNELSEVTFTNRQLSIKVESLEVENQSLKS